MFCSYCNTVILEDEVCPKCGGCADCCTCFDEENSSNDEVDNFEDINEESK